MSPTRAALPLFLLALLIPTAVSANMAAPWELGDVVGEPQAELGDLNVARETLSIDLRPLPKDNTATIKAVYTLDNPGQSRTVELFFVAPGLELGTVTLDNATIPAARADKTVPEAWRGQHQYGDGPVAGILFAPTIGPGQHTLSVTYTALATRNHYSHPILSHEIEYILAPARQWAAFGTLDVEVIAPEGWTLDSSLALTPDGDVWRGTFDGLPQDNILLTAKQPDLLGDLAMTFPWLGFVLGLLLAGLLGWKSVARDTSHGTHIAVAIGAVLGGGILAALLFAGFVLLSFTILPDDAVSRTWSYGNAMILAFVSPLVGLVGLVVAFVGRWLAGRRSVG